MEGETPSVQSASAASQAILGGAVNKTVVPNVYFN